MGTSHTPAGADSLQSCIPHSCGENAKSEQKYRSQIMPPFQHNIDSQQNLHHDIMCGRPILHQPTLILEHFNMFLSFLFQLTLQHIMGSVFSASCQHSCSWLRPNMDSCHNGKKIFHGSTRHHWFHIIPVTLSA